MKLALIYPPFGHKVFNENLQTVDQEFGRFPYISFGYVASAAKQCSWNVRLFDFANRKISLQNAFNEIEQYSPDLLAFPAHAVQTFPDMLSWAKKFKKKFHLPQLVGGYEAQYYPLEIMSHDCFDYLCIQNVMSFLPPFLDAFENKKNFQDIPNLIYRRNGELKKTSSEILHPHFKDFPQIDRSIFDHSLYYSHVSQWKNFSIGLSSIGCPYQCSFCCMSSTPFQARSVDAVLTEINDCISKHDIAEIDWFDPLMFANKTRIVDLTKEISAKKIPITWSTRTRIDTLTLNKTSLEPDENFIELLAEGGCKRLFLGIESASDEILKNVHKNFSPNGVSKIIDCLRSYEIRPLGFFMIGNPGETITTIKETISLARKLPLDYAQFSMTLMKPHSELEQKYMKKTLGYDYWREFILGNTSEQILPSPWTELTRKEIESWTKKAYLSFYFRPKIIFKTLCQAKSFTEILRYISVALKLIFFRNKSRDRPPF